MDDKKLAICNNQRDYITELLLHKNKVVGFIQAAQSQIRQKIAANVEIVIVQLHPKDSCSLMQKFLTEGTIENFLMHYLNRLEHEIEIQQKKFESL